MIRPGAYPSLDSLKDVTDAGRLQLGGSKIRSSQDPQALASRRTFDSAGSLRSSSLVLSDHRRRFELIWIEPVGHFGNEHLSEQ